MLLSADVNWLCLSSPLNLSIADVPKTTQTQLYNPNPSFYFWRLLFLSAPCNTLRRPAKIVCANSHNGPKVKNCKQFRVLTTQKPVSILVPHITHRLQFLVVSMSVFFEHFSSIVRTQAKNRQNSSAGAT